MDKRLVITSLGLGLLALTAQAQTDALDHWVWRNPLPFANWLRSVCFGADHFVAVGDGGIVHTSTDGLSWDPGRRIGTNALNGVAYVDGQFIAIGDSGTILSSSNALVWTSRSSGTTNRLLAVSYGNGRFVACGKAGQLVVSTNGITWTAVTISTVDLSSISFGNGVFVVPETVQDYAWSSTLNLLVSTDAESWTRTRLARSYYYATSIHGVAFGNGMFVASTSIEVDLGSSNTRVRRLFSSLDGTNWLAGVNAPGQFYLKRCFTFAGGLFFDVLANPDVALGEAFVYTSTNAQVVTTVPSPPGGFEANSLACGNAIAYGNGRYVMIGPKGKLWTSTNGTMWAVAYSGDRTFIRQIIRGVSHYIAAGTGILISADGTSFSPAAGSPSVWVGGVGFDGSNHVAVGQSGGVWSSTNGSAWVARTSNTSSDLASICRGPTRWVAVGTAGTIISSPSGLAWTKRTSGTENNLTGVAFGNDTFVAVGNGGTVLTSADGAAWDVQFSGTTSNLKGVQYLNDQFFAVGDAGNILASTNGADWQPRTSGTTTPIYAITHGDGRFVAAGFKGNLNPYFTSYVEGLLLQSTNGLDWQDVTSKLPTFFGLNWIAYLDNSFWLTGDFGTILQSARTDGGPRLTGGVSPTGSGFGLSIHGVAGTTYRIQTSTNLTTSPWYDCGTVTNLGAAAAWVDTNDMSGGLHLYRAVSQ